MPTITFRRASNIQNIPITDGQIIFDTNRNIILMDNGNVRNQYAGATQLISTTPEATSTNAFNAQASTQLFLQKTTVIDTKANALAVNQNYIPLGCLAFKEALGTTNYSNVGNGTISGALVTLNNKSNQLDTKLNNHLSANNNEFYFDYQNGKYGYNTDPNRGADTFNPFNNVSEFVGGCAITNNATTSCHCYPGRYQYQAGGKSFDNYACGVRIYVNGRQLVNDIASGDQNIKIMGGTFTVTEEGTMTVQGVGGNNTGMNFISGGVWKLAN